MGLSAFINQNLEDIKSLRNHLEEEYKAGNISVRTYNELKNNYEAKIREMEQDLSESKARDKEKDNSKGQTDAQSASIRTSYHVSEDIKNLKNSLAILAEPERHEQKDGAFQQSVVSVQSKIMSNDLEGGEVKIDETQNDAQSASSSLEKKIKEELEQEQVIEEVEKSVKDKDKKNSKLHELTAIKSLFHRKQKSEKKKEEKENNQEEKAEEIPKQETAIENIPDIQAPDEINSEPDVQNAAAQAPLPQISELQKPEVQAEVQLPAAQTVEQENSQPEIKSEAPSEESSTPAPETEEQKETQNPIQNQPQKEGHRVLGKLFGHKNKEESEKKEEQKKEEQVQEQQNPDAATQQSTETTPETATDDKTAAGDNAGKPADLTLELEKLKVVLETMRETKKATDETLANIFESIGELRSTGFQNDGAIKETTAKLEKIEADVGDINPTAFTKKINDINNVLEKHGMLLEKLDAKSGDLSEKINQVHTLLKTIGGIENLVGLNKELQQKIGDINDVTKYIERVSVKAEKTYIDLNERLSDFVLYKSKQEILEENVKDVIKAIDRINLTFENYMSKKDLDTLNQDLTMMKTQVQDLNKALPIIKLKAPESIANLKKEKDDIEMLMSTLKEEKDRGKITEKEYKRITKKNDLKLRKLDVQLEKEWKKIGKYAAKQDEGNDAQSASSSSEKTESPPAPTEAKEEQPSQSTQQIASQPPAQPQPTPTTSLMAPAPPVEEVKVPEKKKRGRPPKKKEETPQKQEDKKA